MAKYSQMMTSATPYLSSRLLELKNYAASPQYEALRAKVETQSGAPLDGLFDERGYLKKLKGQARPQTPAKPPVRTAPRAPEAPPRPPEMVKMLQGSCPRCRAGFAIRLVERPDKAWLDIPCRSCRRTFRLRLDGVPQG
jgi:hypothetical protein